MRFTCAIGPLLALAVAVALFTRFSFDDTMRRDEAIYAYGGQQLAAGVPLYHGIFDPKTPVAQALAGAAAALAPGRGFEDVHAIRVAFFAAACLSVVAVYWLGLVLWGSPLAALLGATVFASFRSFALDAVGGPDAKTPGILFAVVCLALLVQRRWFWGALFGSLAALVWQPFAVYAVVALAAAFAGARWRGVRSALAGAALPLAVCVVWLWGTGALPGAVEATVSYPLHGVERTPETLRGRVAHIAGEVWSGYGVTGLLLGVGLLALLVVARLGARPGSSLPRERGAWVLAATLVPLVAFSLHDFQGTADAYPFLPYAAVGVAGACALLAGRWRAAVGGAALVAVFGLSFVGYSHARRRDTGLLREHHRALAVQRLVDRGEHFEAYGNPVSLVLTGTRNPTRFVYLSEGVGDWALRHELAGFEGFTAGIRARRPAVVVVDAWKGPLALRTERWLRTRYRPACVGRWLIFLAPEVRERARSRGVRLRRPWHLSCRLHGVREHPLGVDPGVDRAGVQERRPALPIAGDVDVEQRLPQRAARDVDRLRAPVHGDRQLLAGEVRGADGRPLRDVPEAD
jgi:hypothetical protein